MSFYTSHKTQRPTASPAQFLLHQPYGEEFVIQWRGSYDERFTFTGKERDAETGYYYHGARFNRSDIGWLSVDPMADKYPSLSPYAYCAWNPVKYVDPDGETIWIVNEKGEKLLYTTGMSTNGFDKYTSETIKALNKLSNTKTMGTDLKHVTYKEYLTITITKTDEFSHASVAQYENDTEAVPLEQEILFNPFLGIQDTKSNKVLSPAAGLGHEIGHIFNAWTNASEYFKRIETKLDDVWSNKEEYYNITTWEHKIANEWNELKREGHKTTDSDGNERYRIVRTAGSTSTKIDE